MSIENCPLSQIPPEIVAKGPSLVIQVTAHSPADIILYFYPELGPISNIDISQTGHEGPESSIQLINSDGCQNSNQDQNFVLKNKEHYKCNRHLGI